MSTIDELGGSAASSVKPPITLEGEPHSSSAASSVKPPAYSEAKSLEGEQQRALELLLEGKNVFLTGPGGTGKSYFIEHLRQHFDKRIATTALTGCAAILLGHGSKTLHSWAGIGLGKGTLGEIIKGIRINRRILKNWLTTDLLIIDEISMMPAELFDKLNEVAKVIRKSSAPFGGLQVLLVGDFYQLPPISDGPGEAKFAFESSSWSSVVNETVILTHIHRQSEDTFRDLLGRVRIGCLSQADIHLLRSRLGLDWQSLEIRPTLLFSRRAMVDKINSVNLGKLEGELCTWKAKTLFVGTGGSGASGGAASAKITEEQERAITIFDRDGPYDETLQLKIRAQVMLTVNLDIDRGLVNGSRGVIVALDTKGAEPLPIVLFKNGLRETIGRHSWYLDDHQHIARSQIPLRLAWAGTIHKAQGATLDCALIDIGRNTFEYGQAYVALSRVKSLDSLYVYEFTEAAIRAHPRVKEFYNTIK